jgi:hypothetical protein
MRLGLAALLLCACGGDADLPSAADLHGAWTSEDGGQIRDFRFAATDDGSHPELAGLDDVFTLDRYPVGEPPALVQTGTYRIAEGHLVTAPRSGDGAGEEFANQLLDWTGDTFTLEGSAGPLLFTRLD